MLLSAGGLEVEREAALAGVDVQEDAAPLRVRLVVREGTDAAHRVAAVRALDLDHVRAVVGVELRRVGPGGALREIEDANPLEGQSVRPAFGVRHRRFRLPTGAARG